MGAIKNPTGRKYVTTACDTCRESKVKCDGTRASCSNCQHKMRPCNYQAADKRKISWKSVVDLLTNRIDELVQFIVKQGLTPPPMLDDNEETPKNALKTQGLHHIQKTPEGVEATEGKMSKSTNIEDPEPLFSSNEAVTEYLNIGESDPFCDEDRVFMQENNQDSLPQQFDVSASLNEYTKNDTPSQLDIGENDGTENLINRLSDRMGSLQIGSDGQFRYYGPTSHFNLLRMPTPDNLTIHRTIRKDGQDHLNRKEVPKSMEEHLLNQYFTWHSPSVDVVDRNMYETAKQQWQKHMEETSFYSEALTNAILITFLCCLGAAFEPRYHPNFITYPRSLSDFFADRAKTLLDIEFDSPTVATVQAMVVLSGHDIGCKRDARGWLYSGMAMRLAFDLGLHIDMSPYVANGTISEAEADVRRMVFWGAYTLDHHWGFLLGCPFRMNLEDVTVQKPGIDIKQDQDQAERWYPYGLPYPTAFPPGLSIANTASSLSLHRIMLCEIMTPLGHVLYGSLKIPREALQKLNAETTDRLLQWEASLPESLQVNANECTTPPLPHVLLLHLYYHQAIIHAHRPWMSKSSIQPQPQPQQDPGYTHARKMCVESATVISNLLQIYEKFYTFRRMNIQVVSITCSAALMLIFAKALNRRADADETAIANLNICFRALEEFGSAWESAKRAQSFLLHMQGLWDIQIRPYRTGKRAASQFQGMGSHEDFLQSKRLRTSSLPLSGLSEGGHGDCESEEFEWLWAATMGAVPVSQ
ncbi:fungal-specific transcription factor domain-containing protein [Penicillium lividum]|nr:fungal-specific transcription factor domain-containing protein [Penicillium lividum]